MTAIFIGVAAILLCLVGIQGVMRELTIIPPNQFYDTYDERLQSDANQGLSLEKAVSLYDGLPPSALGPNELRRMAALGLMNRKRNPRIDASHAPLSTERIKALLFASLEKEPVHPLSWAYLADAALTQERDPQRGYEYLLQSYRVAPVEPDFVRYRMGLALACQDMWDVDFFEMLRRDVRSLFSNTGWNRNTSAFVRSIKASPRLTAFVGTLLMADGNARERYEAALKRR